MGFTLVNSPPILHFQNTSGGLGNPGAETEKMCGGAKHVVTTVPPEAGNRPEQQPHCESKAIEQHQMKFSVDTAGVLWTYPGVCSRLRVSGCVTPV